MDSALLEELLCSKSFLNWSPEPKSRSAKAPTISLGQGRSFIYSGKRYTNLAVDEKHFSPDDLAKAWGVSAQTIRNVFKDEPDVMTLKKDRIKHGKLFLRTAKTGTDVFCPLPVIVVEALNQIGSKNLYYFWSGQSKPKSAVGNYQRALKTLFQLAKVPRVHAHLFRHTFATEMLLAGNSLETVAALLGHTSTKVTERSYSHWIKGRQEKLEEAVKNSWARLGSQAAFETQNRYKPA